MTYPGPVSEQLGGHSFFILDLFRHADNVRAVGCGTAMQKGWYMIHVLAKRTLAVTAVAAALLAGTSTGALAAATHTPKTHTSRTSTTSSPIMHPDLEWVLWGLYDTRSECEQEGQALRANGPGIVYDWNCSQVSFWWELQILID